MVEIKKTLRGSTRTNPLMMLCAFVALSLIANFSSQSGGFNTTRIPSSSAEKNEADVSFRNAKTSDRSLLGITADFSYKLNVPSNWWDGIDVSPSYEKLMTDLHGTNIWKDEALKGHIENLNMQRTGSPIGSPLRGVTDLLMTHRPKIFLEVGVFEGATSTNVAKLFKETKGFESSYVISMDTWLLDLKFEWNGQKSVMQYAVKTQDYYKKNSDRVSGGSKMYYKFLANCLDRESEDRIIPLPTASANGAMTLLSHGVRPDFMYIDASHANPGVFIDYENFYTILKPGGIMAVDDTVLPPIKSAWDGLVERYQLKPMVLNTKQEYIIKPI